MTFKSLYDLGQKVWIVGRCHAQRIVHCETCKQSGEVTIGGETFVCPKCQGKSKHPQSIGPRAYVAHAGRIGKITVEQYDPLLSRQDQSDSITYMIDSTGIGSGNVWDEKDTFATEAEAMQECESRNFGVNFEDDK